MVLLGLVDDELGGDRVQDDVPLHDAGVSRGVGHFYRELLDALEQLPFVMAAVVATVGILCVFNGYRWHKWVVAVLAFLAGLGIGYKISQQMGKSLVVATAVGGLCAIIATPLLRFTVAIFGGITGAFIGANTWTAVNANPPDAHWAGAAIGFIIVAMASVVLFRLVVVLFTSVGGAAMAVLGGVTLLMRVPAWENTVRESLTANHMLIPLLLLLAAVSGFVIQESRLRAHGLTLADVERAAAKLGYERGRPMHVSELIRDALTEKASAVLTPKKKRS